MKKGTCSQQRGLSGGNHNSAIDLDQMDPGALTLSFIHPILKEDELTGKLIEAIRSNKLKLARELCDQLHSLREGMTAFGRAPEAQAASDGTLCDVAQ